MPLRGQMIQPSQTGQLRKGAPLRAVPFTQEQLKGGSLDRVQVEIL